MPNLYPCTVTVTQENTPLEDADILFVSDDPSLANWSVGGTTDAAGKAQIKTHAKFNGIPKGTFTVLVTKQETVMQGEPKIVGGEKINPPRELYYLVDPLYSVKETSPLKFTMEEKTTSASFDVGKKIRQKVSKENQLKL